MQCRFLRKDGHPTENSVPFTRLKKKLKGKVRPTSAGLTAALRQRARALVLNTLNAAIYLTNKLILFTFLFMEHYGQVPARWYECCYFLIRTWARQIEVANIACHLCIVTCAYLVQEMQKSTFKVLAVANFGRYSLLNYFLTILLWGRLRAKCYGVFLA